MEFRQYFGQGKEHSNKADTSRQDRDRREVLDAFGMGQDRPKAGAVIVTDLMDYITEKDLQELFREFGDIQRIKVPRDRDKKTGEWLGRGVAYITFWDAKDARAALELDGTLYEHSRIRVRTTRLSTQRPRR